MGNNTKTQIVIDGIEYHFEDMTQDQQVMVNHVADLDRKLASARFNVDQLQVGREAFYSMLKSSLAASAQKAEEAPAAQEEQATQQE
jgi:hypothetical protein